MEEESNKQVYYSYVVNDDLTTIPPDHENDSVNAVPGSSENHVVTEVQKRTETLTNWMTAPDADIKEFKEWVKKKYPELPELFAVGVVNHTFACLLKIVDRASGAVIKELKFDCESGVLSDVPDPPDYKSFLDIGKKECLIDTGKSSFRVYRDNDEAEVTIKQFGFGGMFFTKQSPAGTKEFRITMAMDHARMRYPQTFGAYPDRVVVMFGLGKMCVFDLVEGKAEDYDEDEDGDDGSGNDDEDGDEDGDDESDNVGDAKADDNDEDEG